MASAQPAVDAIYEGLGGDVNNLQTDNDMNVVPQLGVVDGDADTLIEATAANLQRANVTPTDEVVGQLNAGDTAHAAGDAAVGPVNAVQG